MTAKEYLTLIRQLDIKIGQKLSELDELHIIAMSLHSLDFSADKVQTSPKGEAPYAGTAEKAVEIDKEIRVLEDQKLSIIDSIRALDDHRYTQVLYKRYVEYKKFDKIADEMGYNERYIYQLHDEALEQIEIPQ